MNATTETTYTPKLLKECGAGSVRYSLVTVLKYLYERRALWTHEVDQISRCIEQALVFSKDERVIAYAGHALEWARKAVA